MAPRQPALHPVLLVVDEDCDALRERFKKALPKARLGWIDAKTGVGSNLDSPIGKRKPDPVIRIHVRARRLPGMMLSDALLCAANAHYSHLFLVSDPDSFTRLLELAKTFPDRLIEDGQGRIAVFPLKEIEKILRADELHAGACFETDLKLHWKKRDGKTETADDITIQDHFQAGALGDFLTKLRFYCKAQASHRPWS